MPTRKIAGLSGPVRASRQRHSRAGVDGIVSRRQRLVDEVSELHRSDPSRLMENARQLLTRWWSAASWSAREQLLQNVEWLVRVERNRRKRSQSST